MERSQAPAFKRQGKPVMKRSRLAHHAAARQSGDSKAADHDLVEYLPARGPSLKRLGRDVMWLRLQSYHCSSVFGVSLMSTRKYMHDEEGSRMPGRRNCANGLQYADVLPPRTAALLSALAFIVL